MAAFTPHLTLRRGPVRRHARLWVLCPLPALALAADRTVALSGLSQGRSPSWRLLGWMAATVGGTIAAYGRPGQRVNLFEVDPRSGGRA